jgi:hypothetical protein
VNSAHAITARVISPDFKLPFPPAVYPKYWQGRFDLHPGKGSTIERITLLAACLLPE